MSWHIPNWLRRLLTSLVGAFVLVAGAWQGGWYFAVLVAIAAMLGQWEWYGLLQRAGMRPWRLTGLCMGLLLALHPLVPGGARLSMLPLAILLMWMPFSRRDHPVHSFCATVSGALYPSLLLAFLLHLRLMEQGFSLVLTVFILVWVSDSCAYAVGSRWGRHKLAPIVSPNKTWEGYIAGLLGPLFAGVMLHVAFASPLVLIEILALSLTCGVGSASGDLAASRFKRAVQLDTTGSVLPGHGGILDRFDGMMVAAPLAYFFVWVLAAG